MDTHNGILILQYSECFDQNILYENDYHKVDGKDLKGWLIPKIYIFYIIYSHLCHWRMA